MSIRLLLALALAMLVNVASAAVSFSPNPTVNLRSKVVYEAGYYYLGWTVYSKPVGGTVTIDTWGNARFSKAGMYAIDFRYKDRTTLGLERVSRVWVRAR